MSRSITVCLGDGARVIGTLRFNADRARQTSAFEYAPNWLSSPDRFAISPDLPLVAGPQFHRQAGEGSAFHLAIADAEPDGWAKRVIRRAQARLGRRTGGPRGGEPLSALDFLLAVDDFSRVGALRFRDESGTFQRAPREHEHRAPPLVELKHLLAASRAVELDRETAADLDYLTGKGTSLGGLRPKCSVIDDDGTLAIGKFPSVADERAVTKGEVLALQLGAAAGLSAARARLVKCGSRHVALVKRFDRDAKGRRIPFISAATLLGVDATDSQPHTYLELVDAIRRSGASPQEDLEELWGRIAFSILISNFDDHLRNHGFLHAGKGAWRLSPMFDVNPLPEKARELKTWISDEGPEASVETLRSVADKFMIRPKRAGELLSRVKKAVAGWKKVGAGVGMTKNELDQFAAAFVRSS